MSSEVRFPALALRDRAHTFLTGQGPVSEATLLAHVYGGQPPPILHARLAEPLLGDPRFGRQVDGTWAVGGDRSTEGGLTVLALVATGPSPGRGRLTHITALHVRDGQVVERFSATLNPGKRVPGYVAARLGLAPENLDEMPPFETIVDDLTRFLAARPIAAQDAELTWSFLEAEARRVERVLSEPVLIDVNERADRLLDLKSKPTLALVAAHLGIGTLPIGRPDEEARVLAEVVSRLVAREELDGRQATSQSQPRKTAAAGRPALRRGDSARALPDQPGVYVLRDADRAPLYVGKARRLRSRLEAYVHRPLGATRRLEGLVGAVDAIDPTPCRTDLEALVLEDREIRRLQPRFNVARNQRVPRIWIRLPPPPAPRTGKRPLAPRRLEPSLGPATDQGEFVGPFRNETAAEQARSLARAVFDLDALRRGDLQIYEERLHQAWDFLQLQLRTPGNSSVAEALARQRSNQLLRAVLAFDLPSLLLPADPRHARYAVVRPSSTGAIEGLLIDHGIFRTYAALDDEDVHRFANALLAQSEVESQTGPDEVDVVLRWFGAQRPPARLVHLPDDRQQAADAIEDAALALAGWLTEA
jgi:DNA polymerase III epsilon subunit-like protein